ncbi:MAG: tetratricopeptide repeat protein [Sphingobium sp.]
MFARLMIALAVVLFPAAAHAQWKRATSDNFVVYSSGSEKTLLEFTAKVETFDALLRRASGVKAPPAPKRLEIYLLRDTNSVQRLLGKGGRNVAGFYTPRLAGSIAVVPRLGRGTKFDMDGETVLFHEYAHHFMMQYFPSAYPPWYVEGFAEFYSTAEIGDDGNASIGKPAYHRAYGLILAKPFPIEQLLSNNPKMKGGEEVDAYYGRSWLLAHMLTFSDKRKGQLEAYLSAFASGTPAEKAAIDAFGPLSALEKDLDTYVKGGMQYRKLTGFDTKAARIVVDALDPAQDALLLDRLNYQTGITEEEKSRALSSVRKTAARFPDNPYAIDMLVQAYLLEDKEDEANTLNDKLIALKPDYGPALLRKAEFMANKANDAEDSATHWRTVRTLIVKANRLNNDDTTALFRYYQSFMREGVDPPKVAVDGLFRAYELAPQFGAIRLSLADQFIRSKQPKLARAVLMPIAYAPHGGDGAEAARKMIADIDSKGDSKSVKTPSGDGKAKPNDSQQSPEPS